MRQHAGPTGDCPCWSHLWPFVGSRGCHSGTPGWCKTDALCCHGPLHANVRLNKLKPLASDYCNGGPVAVNSSDVACCIGTALDLDTLQHFQRHATPAACRHTSVACTVRMLHTCLVMVVQWFMGSPYASNKATCFSTQPHTPSILPAFRNDVIEQNCLVTPLRITLRAFTRGRCEP